MKNCLYDKSSVSLINIKTPTTKPFKMIKVVVKQYELAQYGLSE